MRENPGQWGRNAQCKSGHSGFGRDKPRPLHPARAEARHAPLPDDPTHGRGVPKQQLPETARVVLAASVATHIQADCATDCDGLHMCLAG